MKNRFSNRILIAGLLAGSALCAAPMQGALAAPSQFTDHANGTVTDNVTGLTWDKCALGQIWNKAGNTCSQPNDAATFNWLAALQEVERWNAARHRGHADWRLPNKNELESLVDIRMSGPAIDSTVFDNTPANGFWSSTTYAAIAAVAWYVNFDDGNVYAYGKPNPGRIRLVRGGPES